ncbi:MAG: DUF4328 domain-containing protein [Pirellulaceae bacterium]|nr:DUF4328 domain-containing protein [Pirellulaceae bacterium]
MARAAGRDDEYEGPPFRSPALLAIVMKILLGVFILHVAAGAYVHLNLSWLWHESIPASELDNDAISIWSTWASWLFVTEILLTVIVEVWLMFWMYRCHRNLEPLGHRQLDSKHIWAVICWFIPVLNLYCPYQVMREIWWRSFPLANESADSAPRPHLVFWWWLLGVTAVAPWYMAYLLGSPATMIQYYAQERLVQISWGCDIVSALLAIIIVHRISHWQTSRYQLLTRC